MAQFRLSRTQSGKAEIWKALERTLQEAVIRLFRELQSVLSIDCLTTVLGATVSEVYYSSRLLGSFYVKIDSLYCVNMVQAALSKITMGMSLITDPIIQISMWPEKGFESDKFLHEISSLIRSQFHGLKMFIYFE